MVWPVDEMLRLESLITSNTMRPTILLKSDKISASVGKNIALISSLGNSHNQIESPPSSKFHISPTHLNILLNRVNKANCIKHATQIHTQIITHNYTSLPFLFNNLLNLYAKCGYIDQSLTLFSATHDDFKNIVTWTTLITRLSHSEKPFEALSLFNEMRRTGVYPNHFTFSAVLPACADTLIAVHGEQLHSLICKHGFEFHLFVGSALLDMYAKCGDMSLAEQLFDEIPERNLVTWNSMIVGFLKSKLYDRAIEVFKDVLGERLISPDQVSFSSVLSACANVGNVDNGKQVHGVVVKHGLMPLAYVRNSLMDMYFKCGSFEDSVNLFRTMNERDVVTWNVMVMGCVGNGKFEEACNYFWSMRCEGILPDETSFSTALHAAASIAALDQGTLVHDHIIKTGFETNMCVASSLIVFYAKCGSLVDARKVFDEGENRNVVCWTAMISAYQQHGCANQVIKLFEGMLEKGIMPDYITFVCILSACSHTGCVDEGFSYFNSMTERHNMNPGPEHYACMVDLLGRAGRLCEAKSFIESMPIEPNASVWGALLGACRNYGNLEMGREVAERLFEIEPENTGNYVLLCNMYARHGRLEEADEVRRLMGVKGIRKETGCSWIDFKNQTFIFTANDRSNSRTNEIYNLLGKLEVLVKKKGYVAETQYAVNNIEEDKEKSLWYHSERLALAFGLLTLPANAPIRIKKNMRTCGDCHTVLKFASQIFKREIVVRDINRYHRFSEGLCSCRDYW